MRPTTPVLTYAGIALCAAGFVILAFAWGRVAAQAQVIFQIPYLISGGLTGLAVVMLGVLLINVNVKVQEGMRRERQLQQVVEVLQQVVAALDGPGRPAGGGDTTTDLGRRSLANR